MKRVDSQDAMAAIEGGTAEEARVALARLLSVTEASLERTAQLERALTSRIAIEQAKGMLSERLGVGVDEAFELLRRAARTSQRKLHDLAREVVTTRETPEAIRAVYERVGR
jgi:AmiR/NasT family two-component response regulator